MTSPSSFHDVELYDGQWDPFEDDFPSQQQTQLQEAGKLRFCQLRDWEEGRTYNELPAKYLRYSIHWSFKIHNRVQSTNTETDLVLNLASHWRLYLKPKLDQADEFPEKKLTVEISFNYEYVETDQPPMSSRRTDKRGRFSTTQQQLHQREIQLNAEEEATGQPSITSRVYKVMRCPGAPCNLGPHCWVDPMTKKHYKLKWHHFKDVAPLSGDPTRPPIVLAQDGQFQKDLKKSAVSNTPRESLESVSRTFIASDKFISSIDGSQFQKKVVEFSAIVDKLETAGIVGLKAVSKVVKQAFGQEPSDLVKSVELVSLLQGLRDSIVAIKYVQEEHHRPIASLADQLRNLELIEKAASPSSPHAAVDPSPNATIVATEAEWISDKNYSVGYPPVGATTPDPPEIDVPLYRKRTLLLPVEADLKSILSLLPEDKKKADDDRCKAAEDAEKEASELLIKHADLKLAIIELVKLSPENLEVKAAPEHPGVDIDVKFTRDHIVGDQLEYRSSLRKIALSRADINAPTTLVRGANTDNASGSGAINPSAAGDLPTQPVNTEPTGAFNLAKDLLSSAGLLGPLGSWKAVPVADRTPRVKATALDDLSETTEKVLKDRGIDLTGTAVSNVVGTLRRELNTHVEALQLLVPSALLYGFKIPKFTPALPALPLDGRVPHSKGNVAPSGIADLLVVKQTLKGYQAADIAHVENVLKGESKQRTHKKTTRAEALISTETETNNSEENELSSTSRFEMSKETSNTIKEDQSLKTELKVSAKYGPAKYSQDVTERTVKKITERVLQKQSTTSISEIMEENQHGTNNSTGSGHISGVYQWPNKVYEAQVFNYGLRTMFDFMIPEPAAFLIYAITETANNAESGLLLEKPSPFTFAPSEIEEEMIGNLITQYQATDVLPPPDDYITITDQTKIGGGDPNVNYDHAAALSIPSGYEAIYGTISNLCNVWKKDGSTIDAMVGSETHRFDVVKGDWTWGTSLLNRYKGNSMATGGSIPWGFNTYNIQDAAVSVEVLCRVTERRKELWQADTHAKILSPHPPIPRTPPFRAPRNFTTTSSESSAKSESIATIS
ncbi:hypothetical protein DL98DRAFT_599137 [Cadophora sp. DSE1049]|nr:hypothetical protein DL98DRAFT_599137 [Cadophora sp. DSE1049]